MAETFSAPDWSAPLELHAALAAIPEHALVKGMFFHAALDKVKSLGKQAPGRGRYVGFKDYTVREHAEVLVGCAELAFPECNRREGLRRLGADAYRTFVDSMVGRVIFSVAARQWPAAVRLVGRAYSVVGNTSQAEVKELESNHAVLRFAGVFNFPDSYHVGVLEAGMEDYGLRGEVLVRPTAPGDTEYKMIWQS